MAENVATLQAQLDALRRAYRSGAHSVSYDGKSITYRSLDEMRAAIASIEAELGVRRGRVVVVRTSKGW